MPDHFHLLVRPVEGASLSSCMQWLQTSFVRRFNDYYDSEGPLWQGRYRSFLVQEDAHLLTVMSYIEGHPLRAGLVDTAEDYVWSSHRENYWGNLRRKLDTPPFPLGNDWAASVNAMLSEKTLARLQLSTQRQIPFGSAAWQEEVCSEYGLEDSTRPRGRPRKECPAAMSLVGLLLCLSLLLPRPASADDLNHCRFLKISEPEQAAVLIAADGSLQLVRVGDRIAPGLRITAIAQNRVILEKSGEMGPVTLRVEIAGEQQTLTRMERR
jgi:putative transposase